MAGLSTNQTSQQILTYPLWFPVLFNTMLQVIATYLQFTSFCFSDTGRKVMAVSHSSKHMIVNTVQTKSKINVSYQCE